MNVVTTLLAKAMKVYRIEGPGALLRRGLAFALGQVFRYERYCLCAHFLDGERGTDAPVLAPGISDLKHMIVFGNEEADRLEAEGYEFRSCALNGRERLEKGAAALCVFAGHELVNIVWIAMSQEARRSLGEPPYEVDFSKHEVAVGGGWTNPRYRRMGLRVYGHAVGSQFLQANGVLTSRYAIARRNTTALSSTARVGVHVYGEGRYLRILWWESWKERPLALESAER